MENAKFQNKEPGIDELERRRQSNLGRLCPDSNDIVRINKKVLFAILKSHDLFSQAEFNRNPGYNNTHPSYIAEEKMIVELDKLGILEEFLSI